MVAIRIASAALTAVASRWVTFCSSEPIFMHSHMLTELLEMPPSVPRPTVTPRSRNLSRGAGPLASFMLLTGQWATAVPVEASTSISASSSHTQWASTEPGRRMPRSAKTWTGRPPNSSITTSTSSCCSLVWVWMFTP